MCGPAKPNSRQRREGIAGQESESAVRPLLLLRGHTPDNESSPRVKSCDVYSEDTQIGTPDNGGIARLAPDEGITQRAGASHLWDPCPLTAACALVQGIQAGARISGPGQPGSRHKAGRPRRQLATASLTRPIRAVK